MSVSRKRILVQMGIHAAFVDRLTAAVRKLRVGNGLEDGVDIGPLIEANGLAKVVEHVADARALRATTVLGGKPSDLGGSYPYGLAAYFYTRDLSHAWRVAEALEVGMVGINAITIANESAPFGGVKESGIGREGSKYGIEEWIEMKFCCFGV
jgi:succinate-semialdehyde dehydrogenase/glutarate-semialdehyde dehydrogenase